MLYRFGPTPVDDDPLIKVGKVPDPGLVDYIVHIGDQLPRVDGQVGFVKQQANEALRISKISWIYPGRETKQIFEGVEQIMQDANSRFFHYDLAGFHDALQYTVYDANEGGHFDWHLDLGDHYNGPQRKLSMSIILSDDSEYEGGDFQTLEGAVGRTLPKGKGTVLIFPSYVLHRVTKITKGVRKALIAWTCGPRFR